MAESHRKEPNEHREYMRQRAVDQRKEFSNFLAQSKSQGCIQCGFLDHRALVFHHRDPSTKSFQINQNAWARKTQDILDEISKCDVLCANCHQIRHYRRYDV